MAPPVPPILSAGPQQAQAQAPQNQTVLALADREPTYSIFGVDGGSQLIQFHMLPGQRVTIHGGLTGGSSFLYAHPDVSVYERPRYYRGQAGLSSSSVIPKDEYCSHPGGDDPLIYLGAAAPHAGKILPIKRFGERMPLLVQHDHLLASTGQVEFKQVCMKAGEESLEMTHIAPLAYSQWETRRSVRWRPATVFVHAPGSIMETNLGPNEGIHVYTSAIAALTEGVTLHPPSTNASLYWAEKKKEVCMVQGPGTLYVSSSPLSKQARRLMKARPTKSNLLLYVQCFFGAWGSILIAFVIVYAYLDLVTWWKSL